MPNGRTHPWSEDEVARLRLIYSEATVLELAKAFPDRSKQALRDKAWRLGLRRITEETPWYSQTRNARRHRRRRDARMEARA